MKQNRWWLWLVLLASTAYGQLDVSTQSAAMLVDVDKITQIDDIVLVPASGVIATKPVAVLTVKTEAGNVEVQASDIQRLPVESRQLSGGRWLFERPGKYWVEVTAIDFAKNIYGRKTVVVEVGQGPNPPPPPPGPSPPGPTPPPSPDGAPIAGEGLRVLFIHESSEALAPELQQVFFGTEVRSYLTANAIKVEGTPDWRILDKDVKFTDPNHRFARAMARTRSSIPWLIISNGTTGYEGPFPGGVAETLELLKAFSPQNVTTKATVSMYTVSNCLWCDKWKSMELPTLLSQGSADYREIEDTASTYQKHPTFVIRKDGKAIALSGYQTTATLLAEAAKL